MPEAGGEASKSGFQTFEDLEVYKVAREFRKAMYAVTRQLPDFEKYDLASQVRRAAVSLTNNIAEGHGRFHYPDQIRFILHSRGSLEELVDDLNVCLDENYLGSDEVAKLKKQGRGVLILINGYLRYLRSRSSSVRESDALYSENPDPLDDLPL
ncbi:MAG: four helix bundle protein [Verrucomicrobiota bacterium]|jgi:four helix bundle protein|nr:four helix bundle protein [Verrucomicrobiota bacterium]